ncbi:MAG: IS110 family transposase [FCB group bacterium]|nr:IS110 family transposase [FCB group bacterium]
MKQKIAYLAMDLHVKTFTLGKMDEHGSFKGSIELPTSENHIIDAIQSVKSKRKYLTIEQGPLTYWAAQVANPYVDQVIACDPRANALIFKNPYKKDKVDTKNLCRLLRMDELHHVYQPQSDDRALFKAAALHYIDLRNQLTRFKQKIKAMYRHWGIISVFTDSVYSQSRRDHFLEQIKGLSIRNQLLRLYHLMDQTKLMQQYALKSLKDLGRNYPEIQQFIKIPGIADINAHLFDAFIQTPHRFTKTSQLWKYCRLSITDRSSDGKPLGYQRLDRNGIGELKALSYRAFVSAMKGDNEVKRFYHQSLQRTHCRKHARLNTQRKILAAMYTIWKKGVAYRPELFAGSA